MKKPGLLAASVAAASVTAFSASSSSSSSSFVCDSTMRFSHQEAVPKRNQEISGSSSPSTDKFAPRFDGLRFIETLITAHR